MSGPKYSLGAGGEPSPGLFLQSSGELALCQVPRTSCVKGDFGAEEWGSPTFREESWVGPWVLSFLLPALDK